jgi:rod shape determining protein RodA
MKQPDLGTSLLVLAAGLSVIFFAGLSWKLIVPPVVLALVGMVLLVVLEPRLCADGVRWVVLHDYQQQRICTLLDPSRDPLGKGFHIIQGMIAIGSGGMLGKGFMQGTQTHLEFIPERTTDFIFAAFSEEFGLMGNLLLIAAFIFLILRGFAIALDASTLFSRLLAGCDYIHLFHLRFCQYGHGQWDFARGRRALAFHQLWRNGHGDTGHGPGHFDVCGQGAKVGAVMSETARWHCRRG